MAARDLPRLLRIAREELTSRYERNRDPVAHARGLGVRVGENCRLLQCNFGS